MASKYKAEREAIIKDYRINNPFSLLNKRKCNEKLLPKSPDKYEQRLKILKMEIDEDMNDWIQSFKSYNKEILNNNVKDRQAQNDKKIIKNRMTAINVEKQTNIDIETNDKKLYLDVKTLENLKKKLAHKKIKFNKLLHSANASEQFKDDKESLYTETTVRFILQIIGILIAGGLTYKVSTD